MTQPHRLHLRPRVALRALPYMLIPMLAACEEPAPQPPRPVPKVGVIQTQLTEHAAQAELRGRVEAARTAEVRARVTGVVLERVFEEGDQVEAGDVLFRIDPAPMKAALQQSNAQVAVARAALRQAQQTQRRLKPLAGTRAVSAQIYDDAVAAVDQAEANLALVKAQRTTAKLNLDYATVTAPISGQIGRALVTEGALVTAAANTPLATIVQMDPVFVNMTVPVSELRRYRQGLREGALKRTGGVASVSLFDNDGWTYAHNGTVLFTDVSVDPTTGSTLLRATVPNPDRDLLPGMYVRARVSGSATEQATSVPKQAVIRDADGDSVLVVEDNKAQRRPVKVSGGRDNAWIVREGLEGGETVVVDGLQHVASGQAVQTVAWEKTVTAEAEGAQ